MLLTKYRPHFWRVIPAWLRISSLLNPRRPWAFVPCPHSPGGSSIILPIHEGLEALPLPLLVPVPSSALTARSTSDSPFSAWRLCFTGLWVFEGPWAVEPGAWWAVHWGTHWGDTSVLTSVEIIGHCWLSRLLSRHGRWDRHFLCGAGGLVSSALGDVLGGCVGGTCWEDVLGGCVCTHQHWDYRMLLTI